jgi:hypothetical protein
VAWYGEERKERRQGVNLSYASSPLCQRGAVPVVLGREEGEVS